MYLTLFRQYLKSLLRKIRFDLNFIFGIFSLFSILYLFFAIFYLGLKIGDILSEFKPNKDPIDFINFYLIYFFSFDFLLRYFFQKNHNVNFIPWLPLPIKRTKLSSFILFLTLINFFNLYFLLFIVPFSITNIIPVYGILSTIIYLLVITLILMFSSFFVLLIHNLVYFSSLFALIPALVVILVIFLEFVFNISLSRVSLNAFNRILQGYYLLLYILFFYVWILVKINASLLRRQFYRIFNEKKTFFYFRLTPNGDIIKTIFDSYTVLEIQLILRNKKLRGTLFVGIYVIILFYFLIYKKQLDFNFSFLIYIFVSGILGYNYAQFMFSWESSYFDFLSVTYFDKKKYIKTKYVIFILSSCLIIISLIPLIIQNRIYLYSFISALFYNFSIGYFLIFYVATFNTARIDLNANILFNYSKYKGLHIIALFFILFAPYILLLILRVFFNETISLLVINIISIYSLFNYKNWIKLILRNLSARKYINLEGYRR